MSLTPRLRMFAGPNGSGKSTIKEVIAPQLLGVYINPDEIEKSIRQSGYLNLSDFNIRLDSDIEALQHLSQSTLLARANLVNEVGKLSCRDGRLDFSSVAVNSYYASAISDFIRNKLLEARISFTFETVMSSPDKVDFLAKAKAHGFRT